MQVRPMPTSLSSDRLCGTLTNAAENMSRINKFKATVAMRLFQPNGRLFKFIS